MFVFLLVTDIELNKECLVQELITNQFLLHGHVMTIAIFVIITSAVPLRVYILDSDHMNTLASKPWQPDNFTDPETYVTNTGSNSFFKVLWPL